MFLRNLTRWQVRQALKSCEKKITEIKKNGVDDAEKRISVEQIKMTALLMRLERPAIEKTYSLICPTCHEEWNYTNNDTHRFKCCPNCGRWFGKKRVSE